MGACLATRSVTSAANKVFQCLECMFHPGLANLFEAFIVIGSAAHPIEVLRHDRVIGARQRKPVNRLVAVVTRVCSYRETHLCSNGLRVELVHVLEIPNDDIW